MPYGETRVESGQRLDLGYTGHKWDAETKQYFAPYRYYSTANSRWISRDPLGFVDGPNVYGYVGGMPTTAVDPLGLDTTLCMGGYIPFHSWLEVPNHDVPGRTIQLHFGKNFDGSNHHYTLDRDSLGPPVRIPLYRVSSTPQQERDLARNWKRRPNDYNVLLNNCWHCSIGNIPDPPKPPRTPNPYTGHLDLTKCLK